MGGRMNFRSQIHSLGVLFEIEVEYTYAPPESDTGFAGEIEITEVWVLGYYPEHESKRRDYVPVNVKSRLNCLSNEEYEYLESKAERDLKRQEEEAYED